MNVGAGAGGGVSTAPGELNVKFAPGMSASARDEVRVNYGVVSYDVILGDVEHWKISGDVDAAQRVLAHDPHFKFAEPNYFRKVQGYAAPERQGSNGDQQWWLGSSRGIDIDHAWASAAGYADTGVVPGAGITVAIVDTGVDIHHPDLRSRIATDSNGVPKFIDCVGDDFPKRMTGYNFKGVDGNGHGTHVAGIIAAAAGNNPQFNNGGPTGDMVGIAPGATILPIKAMEADGNGKDDVIAQGLVAAADAGADIINFSVGGPAPSQTLADALAYDFAKGVIVVIASGNGFGAVYYPAAYPGVICVGATTGTVGATMSIAPYSNRGPELTLVAPGGDAPSRDASRGIRSTLPTYTNFGSYVEGLPINYGVESGTSMATPMVSGVAALVQADSLRRFGMRLTPAQMRERLIATARPLSTSGFHTDSGYGLVDPFRALSWGDPGGKLKQ